MSEVIGWTSCWAPARCRLPKGHLSVSSPHFYVGTSNDEEDRLRARIAELEALAGEVDQLRAVVRAARDFRNVCEDAGYQHAGANYGPLCDALDAMGHTL